MRLAATADLREPPAFAIPSLLALASRGDHRLLREIGLANTLYLHGFGQGVQIYTWNGSNWGNPMPEATLFDVQGNAIATHFSGPTWQCNRGSQVVGTVVPPTVSVDPNAIPWLLLRAVRAQGPGIFSHTTYIQLVNTAGGKAPSWEGTFLGQVAFVPYTADYFFYRKTNKRRRNWA